MNYLLLWTSVPWSESLTAGLAYVGPGAGLGMIPSLVAVICVVGLALLAPLLYPLRLYLRWRRRAGAAARDESTSLRTESPAESASNVK